MKKILVLARISVCYINNIKTTYFELCYSCSKFAYIQIK